MEKYPRESTGSESTRYTISVSLHVFSAFVNHFEHYLPNCVKVSNSVTVTESQFLEKLTSEKIKCICH